MAITSSYWQCLISGGGIVRGEVGGGVMGEGGGYWVTRHRLRNWIVFEATIQSCS